MDDRVGESPIKRALMSMQDTIACKGTVTKTMLRKLLRAGVISHRQFDNLQTKKSTYTQIQELMKVVQSKTEALDLFIEVLQTEKSNGWILKKLKEKVTNFKRPKNRKTENHQYYKSENPELFDHMYSETFPLVFGKDENMSNHRNLPEEKKHTHLNQFTQELSECRNFLDTEGLKDLSLKEVIRKRKENEVAQIKEQKKRYNTALLQQIEDNYALQQEIVRLKVTMENKEREKMNVIETEVHRRVKHRLVNFDQPISTKVDSARNPRFPSVFQSDLENPSIDFHAHERQHSMMSNHSD